VAIRSVLSDYSPNVKSPGTIQCRGFLFEKVSLEGLAVEPGKIATLRSQ
jgi:hypothetical protein